MIAANSLRVEGAGFGGNTNVVTVITKEKEVSLGKMTKEETAAELLTMIAEARKVLQRQAHIRTLSKSDRLRAAQRHRDLKLCGVVLFYS